MATVLAGQSMSRVRLSTMTGGELRAAREALGLTQKALGELLGVSKTEIYHKEHGLRGITVAQALAMRGLTAQAQTTPHQHSAFRTHYTT